MGDYINNALLDASPYKKQLAEAKSLVNKWDKTGLLDGLNEEMQKNNMAVLLENQAKQLINENSGTGGTAGGSTGGAGSEEWSGVALPLVRRIFGEISAQEFVSVQPMNLPSGLVFFLDFQYGKARMGFEAGKSLQGTTGPNSPSGSSSPYPDGGLYGVGKYGYTVGTGSNQSLASTASVAYVTPKSVNFDVEFSESFTTAGGGAVKTLHKLVSPVLSNRDKVDLAAVRGWNVSIANGGGDGSNFTGAVKEYPQFRTYDSSTGKLTLIVSGTLTGVGSIASNLASASISVDPIIQNTEAARGDFEDTGGNATQDSLQIPEVDLQLRSAAIVAKTRKLKAVWTPELAQDLNAYHSVDAEAELTSMLSEYISMEIDLEIVDMLLNDAITTDYWSVKAGRDYDANTKLFSDGSTFYGTRFEWFQTLGQKIQKVSNTIHQLTLRGGANFLVCGPKIATILESIPGYMTNTDGNKSQFAMGVQSIGSLQNRYTVYKNPYMTENVILLGFRGSNFLETGAVYAPYVPLIMTPLVYDPSDFTPRKGVMTRYAKKMIRPEFYGKIYVESLDLL